MSMEKNIVRRIQERLAQLGFDPGVPDGALGPNTARAVAAFQRDRNLNIRYPGTIGPRTIAALELPAPPDGLVLPWVVEGRRYLGLHEVRNAKALDKLMRLDTSAIPWCGAFTSLIVRDGLPGEAIPTNPLWARNWLRLGVDVPKNSPVEGCFAVFSRGTGGHVGVVVGHDRTALHVLGGNQSNAVTIARVAKNRCLGLRYPATFEERGSVLPLTTIQASLSTNEA